MECLLLPLILVWIAPNRFANGQRSIQRSIEKDLKQLNVSCAPFDSCAQNRITDSLDEFTCHCGAVCTHLGTCCLDSPYFNAEPPKIAFTCRSLDKVKSYFMIDHCPSTYAKDNIWRSMCEEEWNEENDAMKIIPVTSLVTNYAYKNYFCFRCHENTTDNFFFWNITLGSSVYEFDRNEHEVSMEYDKHFQTWLTPLGKFGAFVPVNLTIETPEVPWPLPVTCLPNVISSCNKRWSEADARRKCERYMGAVSISRNGHVFKYKNVHCAICNFEDVKNITCHDQRFNFRIFKVKFSFTHLLDINRSGGDRVGKIKKCKDNFLWDPYTKRCRKLMCALPGFVVINGKCQRQ